MMTLIELLESRLEESNPPEWPLDESEEQQLLRKQIALATVMSEKLEAPEPPPKINKKTSFDPTLWEASDGN
jgi:hypothetical protein